MADKQTNCSFSIFQTDLRIKIGKVLLSWTKS